MVMVCDAIMGSGKTSSTITLLNEHKNDKFIYITPYLSEACRIRKGCPDLKFVEPSDKLKQYNFRKADHTAYLIEHGKNITTTHQAFKRYTQETLDNIKRQGYTLIIDENVDVLEAFDFHPDDLRLAVDAGYIKEENSTYSIANEDYSGRALRELFSLLKTRDLVRMTDRDDNSLFYWTLPPELLTSFKDVYILTYMFEGQSLHHFMKIYDIPYKYIGIVKDGNTYRFGDYPGYVPEYIKDISNKLHIVYKNKINEIGDDYYALSMNWFKKSEDGEEQVRKNIANCFNNIWRDVPADRKLWGTYNGEYNKIKGKGYTKSFLTFNAKATNQYKGKDCLVYIANLFMNVNEKKFYQMHGIDVDEDKYALSIMIQWIWRSAIREGQEVYLYIPSRRMRELLINWMDNISERGTQS